MRWSHCRPITIKHTPHPNVREIDSHHPGVAVLLYKLILTMLEEARPHQYDNPLPVLHGLSGYYSIV